MVLGFWYTHGRACVSKILSSVYLNERQSSCHLGLGKTPDMPKRTTKSRFRFTSKISLVLRFPLELLSNVLHHTMPPNFFFFEGPMPPNFVFVWCNIKPFSFSNDIAHTGLAISQVRQVLGNIFCWHKHSSTTPLDFWKLWIYIRIVNLFMLCYFEKKKKMLACAYTSRRRTHIQIN